jgi:hypothetical protein
MRRKIKKIGLMKVQVFKKKREKKDSPYPRKRIKERVVHEKVFIRHPPKKYPHKSTS